MATRKGKRTRTKNLAVHPRITANPAVQRGRPVIRGTRVPIHVLVSGVAAGSSIAEVARAYDVTEGDVRAALEYAAQRIAEERFDALPHR